MRNVEYMVQMRKDSAEFGRYGTNIVLIPYNPSSHNVVLIPYNASPDNFVVIPYNPLFHNSLLIGITMDLTTVLIT